MDQVRLLHTIAALIYVYLTFVYGRTETTLEHSTLLPSSTGLEQTCAKYLHLFPMLFLPVLPEDYFDFPVFWLSSLGVLYN